MNKKKKGKHKSCCMKQGSTTNKKNEKIIRNQLFSAEHSLYETLKSWNRALTINKAIF